MANKLTNNLRDPAKVDTAVAESCSRSGAVALLLSLALLTVIPYWKDRPKEIALGTYVALRLNLAVAVDQLNHSVNWKTYTSSNAAAESMAIAQLLDVRVENLPIKTKTETAQSTPGLTVKNKTPRAGASGFMPAPPTGLHAVAGIPEIAQIADFLTKLNDSDLLTKSRAASPFYDLSIYRWALKRSSLFVQNMSAGSSIVVDGGADESYGPNYVPALDKKALLNYLSLRDVRELASFELPIIPDTTKFWVRDPTEIAFSTGLLPRGLYPATISAEVLLLFVIIYFTAFLREGVSTETFPAAGTLFSALARSRWTLAAFALALCIPCLASLTVAVISRKWPLMVISIPICCAVLSIYLLLCRKSYFRTLNARLIISGKRHPKNATASD